VVQEGANKNVKSWNAYNSSLVAMDPKTGQILAMVGSKDYFGKSEPEGCISGKNCKFEPQDNVAVRERQPGSSFKPYVYLTAFTKGYTPETMLFDVETNFSTDSGKDYKPQNYDGKFRGPVQMKEALPQSLNIPAVEIAVRKIMGWRWFWVAEK
jgi:membrane carboxypeptidase/penicillin-binding protein